MNEQALLADPDDWLAWLAYADRLEEEGSRPLYPSLARQIGSRRGQGLTRSAFHFYLTRERWRCDRTGPLRFPLEHARHVAVGGGRWPAPIDWAAACPVVRVLPPQRTRARAWAGWPHTRLAELGVPWVVTDGNFCLMLHGLALRLQERAALPPSTFRVVPARLFLERGRVVGFNFAARERAGGEHLAEHFLTYGRETEEAALVGTRRRPAKLTP